MFQFTGEKYDIDAKQLTKKVKSFFLLKAGNLNLPCKLYIDTFSCGDTYVGETILSVAERLPEHNSVDNKLELAKHLTYNEGCSFWQRISPAATNDSRTCKKFGYFLYSKIKIIPQETGVLQYVNSVR